MVFHHLPHISARGEFSACARFRYRLTLTDTRKEYGKTICVIMQNPSIANDQIADKSVQFLEKLIFEKDLLEFMLVNRCIIVNQFARIQTHFFKGEPEDMGKDNDLAIEKALQESDLVLIAWGKNNPYAKRQKTILELLQRLEPKEVFMTKKHPSRGYYDDFLKPFRA